MTDPAGPNRREAFLSTAGNDPRHTVLALDFDGTLAPLVADPELSRPLPGAMPVLGELGSAGFVLAVISGRGPETVARLAGLSAEPDQLVPGLERLVVHGHYGMQRWSATGGLVSPVSEREIGAVAAVREALPRLLREYGDPDGVSVEDKDVSLVVHTRGAANPQATLDALTPALTALADEQGLRIEPGRFVVELRPDGGDKGGALAGVLTDAGAVAALYAGDDLGDLPAFAVLAEARERGITTLAVASGPATTDTTDDTDLRVAGAADIVVDGPAGVVALLRELSRRSRD